MKKRKIQKKYSNRIRYQKGSMTVEACLVVPFCFFALLSLLCPFQVLVRKNQIQSEMLMIAQMYNRKSEQIITAKTLATDKILLQWKNENARRLCYTKYRIPFAGIGIGTLNCYQQMVVNDYQGISMVPDKEGGGYVYLSESGRVYHLNPQCTHLKIKLRTVTSKEVTKLRNRSGEIYYACEGCVQGKKGNPVYITSYGARYHIKKDCSKISRNVRKVLRSKIGNMPVCSKCQTAYGQKE